MRSIASGVIEPCLDTLHMKTGFEQNKKNFKSHVYRKEIEYIKVGINDRHNDYIILYELYN
jgi:hypothetical protein